GTQRAARVRSLPMRPGVSEESPSHATRGASRSSGNLQRLQPGEFRQSQQYADQPLIRPIDADAGKQSGTRRRERRLQSAVSDWRTALRPVGVEVSILSEVISPGRSFVVARGLLLAGVLLVRCSAAFALNPSLDVSQYAHTVWRIGEGVVTGAVFSLAQTPDGYLWLGTDVGLLRFDGIRSVPWQPPSGQRLPSSTILRVLAARDGTLWIGTTKGLASWNGSSVTLYREFDGQRIVSLLEARDGAVWVGVNGSPSGKLCAVQNGRVRCDENVAVDNGIYSLYEDKHGTLWAGARNALLRWKPGPPRAYTLPNKLDVIYGLSEDEDGLLIG